MSEVRLTKEKALDRLAFLRRNLPSHGTHGDEMFNAFDYLESYLSALSLAQAEIKGHMRVEDDLRRDLANEVAIVNRVWKALGIETYDAAKPFAIDEHVARLKVRIAELEKDAARYRHLRESVTVKDRMFGYCVREWMYHGPCDIATLDAAIDEALKSRA